MEIILANCKLPQNCINKSIYIIYVNEKFELLKYLESNLINMQEILKYNNFENRNYIPTNKFLSTLYFSNLFEFRCYIIDLYTKINPYLDRLCTNSNIHIGFDEIELIEKWLLDGRRSREIYNFQLYDYIYENYPENFGKSFLLPEYYVISPSDLCKVSNEYNLKYLRKYVEEKHLNIAILYENNYLTSELYAKYYSKSKIVEKSCTEILEKIELFVNEEQYKLVFPDNSCIFGEKNSYYFFKILKNIDGHRRSHEYFEIITENTNCIFLVTKKSLEEIQNYIDTLIDDGTNIIIFDEKDYLEIKDIPSDVIIYDFYSDDQYWTNRYDSSLDFGSFFKLFRSKNLTDITCKSEFIRIIQIQELNDVIIFLDGDYRALNELWILGRLKCTIEPIIEIIRVFNQMDNDLNKEKLIDIITSTTMNIYIVGGGIYPNDLIT